MAEPTKRGRRGVRLVVGVVILAVVLYFLFALPFSLCNHTFSYQTGDSEATEQLSVSVSTSAPVGSAALGFLGL